MRVRFPQMNLKNREISERKQVGDAESMINEGTVSGGFFGREGQL